MATSEYGGDQLHLTECLRHLDNMNVVGARRKHSGRYMPCGFWVVFYIFEED
jgi:hypothetical protein